MSAIVVAFSVLFIGTPRILGVKDCQFFGIGTAPKTYESPPRPRAIQQV